MEWTGFIAPGDEMVFTFGVDVNPDVWARTVITNTATIVWGTNSLDLSATTLILAPYSLYLPIVTQFGIWPPAK
jgi:hypothetical protein